jgi:hypothetical protein
MTAVRRAGLDGPGATDLSPETGPKMLGVSRVTASEEAVTVVARTDTELAGQAPAVLAGFQGRRDAQEPCLPQPG